MIHNVITHIIIRHGSTFQFPPKLTRKLPISAPRPLNPTIRTLQEPIRFMASCPRTYLNSNKNASCLSTQSLFPPARQNYLQLSGIKGFIDHLYFLHNFHSDSITGFSVIRMCPVERASRSLSKFHLNSNKYSFQLTKPKH